MEKKVKFYINKLKSVNNKYISVPNIPYFIVSLFSIIASLKNEYNAIIRKNKIN